MVYFIVTIFFDEKGNLKEYCKYIDLVKSIVNQYHGRYIIRSEKITVLNKDWKPDRIIVIEFDSREQMDKCFSSKEYKKIAILRENNVTSKAIIVE